MEITGEQDAAIRELMAGMSLEDKIGQLFVVEVYGHDVDTADPEMAKKNRELYFVDTPAQVIEKYKPGGIIYFGESRGKNLKDPRQIATLSNGLQAAAMLQEKRIPLLISTDQEGGSFVFRLTAPATAMPGNMALGATQSEDDAFRSAKIIGTELAAVGINQNYAPVADVNVNPANPVIGMRSFGERPVMVSSLVAAQVKGYREGGVTAVAKHFPGHGNTTVDSHFGLPEVPHTRAQLRTIDLPPFKAAIAAKIDSIMTGHLVLKSVDPSGVPATMSYAILTGLLRDELRYDGLIITDGLDMAGAAATFPPSVAPVQALKAGADQLLLAPQMDVAYSAVRYAFDRKEIPGERLDESVYRILRLKMKLGLFEDPYVDAAAAEYIVGAKSHAEEANAIADHATTLIRNDDGVLPLNDDPRKVLVTGVGGDMKATQSIGEAIRRRRGQTVTVRDTAQTPSPVGIDQAVAEAGQADLVVVVTGNASNVNASTGNPTDSAAAQQRLVNALVATGRPVVVVAMRNPYDISHLPLVTTCLATYGSTPASAEALVRVLFNDNNPGGKLPVRILTADGSSVLYPLGHGLSYRS